jgi:hypothetical protein
MIDQYSHKSSETEFAEILNPRVTPELGFQSYEMLGGDGEYREKQKALFINGEIYNPQLDYPKLNLRALSNGISKLEKVLSVAEGLSEPQRSTVWDSVAYRMAEMYWLIAMSNINQMFLDGQQEKANEIIPMVQVMGEQLYGKPDQLLEEQIIGELAAQISTKTLDDKCTTILNDLKSGYRISNGNFDIEVPAIEISGKNRLKHISDATLEKLRNSIIERFPDVIALVERYHKEIVLKRTDGQQLFTPEDMLKIFQEVHQLRDPENMSGVSVVFDNDNNNLAWSTPIMSVVVGGRIKPESSLMGMIGRVVHEYGFHCGRAINGMKSDLAVLGAGVYSEAEPGQQPDYLTFEEGVASLGEKALNKEPLSFNENDINEELPMWNPVDIEKTLGICLAYRGFDFRQTYETLWRARVLMLTKNGKQTTEKMLKTAKSNAYNSCVRIYRGTPTSRKSQNGNKLLTLTFNKDMAYLKGKLIASEFVEFADAEDMNLLFMAKIDPTNPIQRGLAEQYINSTDDTAISSKLV